VHFRAAASALLASLGIAKRLAAIPALPRKFSANDTVTFGPHRHPDLSPRDGYRYGRLRPSLPIKPR